MTISLYENTFSKNFTVCSPETMIQQIVSGQWEKEINYLRLLPKEQYKTEKLKLPACTWSGVFDDGTRLIESIKSYSRLVVIDVDNLELDHIRHLKSLLFNDPFVKFCFISPSGNGIKIVVHVNTDHHNHRAAFLHLQHYFETTYGIKVDKSGKDVCRLCFVSHDPEAIIKESKVFEVDLKYGEIITQHNTGGDASSYVATENVNKIFQVCIKWVERNKTYVQGERNVYIHALACALNRCGVMQEDAIKLINATYETPDQKWLQSVQSAYFHNQAEHGTKQVKDIGAQEFVAPPYIANYTQDVAANDLMRITAMMYHHKVNTNDIFDIVSKVALFYNKEGYIDINRDNLPGLMNQAIQVLNQNMAQHSASTALKYETAEDIGKELVSVNSAGTLPTYIKEMDEALGGGLLPGNFYGLIGFGGTFKSIIVQYWAYMHAMNDIPVLFINGEMSRQQYYERLALQTLGVNLRYEMSQGRLNEDNIDSFIEQLNIHTKRNSFVHSGTDFTKEGILSTIDHIYATTGKKVKMVIMDGLTQMAQLGREEAQANIHNSGICKQISKEAHGGEGVALVALIHCSGKENKLIRNTGTIVRGGSKLIANMDAFFCTSLFIDPHNINIDNPEDVSFIDGKFCFRLHDKRSTAGVVYSVVNVTSKIHLEAEGTDYRQYEHKQQQ